MLCLTATGGRATARAAGVAATSQAAAPSYARHVPGRTLLYTLVQAHYPDFIARLEAEDRSLPKHVHEEFEEYLRCGVLDHGFLRVVCEECHAERLVAFSCKKRGFETKKGQVHFVINSRPCKIHQTITATRLAALSPVCAHHCAQNLARNRRTKNGPRPKRTVARSSQRRLQDRKVGFMPTAMKLGQ